MSGDWLAHLITILINAAHPLLLHLPSSPICLISFSYSPFHSNVFFGEMKFGVSHLFQTQMRPMGLDYLPTFFGEKWPHEQWEMAR